MALKQDDPQPQSGKCQQESGSEGFSANMKHKVSYNDESEPALSLSESSILVKPWKEKLPNPELPEMGDATPHPGVQQEKENNWPVNPPLMPLLENSRKEEVAGEDLHDTAAITEADGGEEAGRDGCIMKSTMKRGKKTAKRGPGMRKSNGCRRQRNSYRAAAVVLFFWMAVNRVSLCDASAGNCFTCEEKDQCSKLERIYIVLEVDNGTPPIWERNTNDPLPVCDRTRLLTKKCFVCQGNNSVMIFVENSTITAEAGGRSLKILPVNCEKVFGLEKDGAASHGTPVHGNLLLVLVMVLLIFIV